MATGSALFLEGDSSDRVVVVLAGRIKVFTTDANGRESVLAIRGPGDLLGEIAALDGQPRSASASALEPIELVAISGDAFRGALDSVPGAAQLLLTLVVGRLRDSDRKRAEFGSTDTAVRVARRLVELAERFGPVNGHGGAVPVAITQEELAALTGASREGVSRALGELRRAGLIETGRRAVRVVELERLRSRAG